MTRRLALFVALVLTVVGVVCPGIASAASGATAGNGIWGIDLMVPVVVGAAPSSRAEHHRGSDGLRSDAPSRATLAAGGAKSLGETVGAENVGLTNQVLKGKQPLQALSDAQRQAAADFYRGVAERTTGNLSEAAAEFNRLRADFLEGKTTEVPGNIQWFKGRLPPQFPSDRLAGHLEDAVNGEEQIALESLCENLHDFDVAVPPEIIDRIAAAARVVGLEARYWRNLRST